MMNKKEFLDKVKATYDGTVTENCKNITYDHAYNSVMARLGYTLVEIAGRVVAYIDEDNLEIPASELYMYMTPASSILQIILPTDECLLININPDKPRDITRDINESFMKLKAKVEDMTRWFEFLNGKER